MVIFAAVTFCIIPITLAVVAFSHIMSDASLWYVLRLLRFIFVASPLVALFLGLRGLLPGTRPLAVAKGGADTTLKILTLVVMVIVGLFALGAWVAFQPVPGRPHISVTVLGYTNDATGARLAKIAVTNLNDSTIYVYAPRIEIQAPTDPRGYEDFSSGVNFSWNSTLDKGASGSFTIPPPTNQSPWRLSFHVYPDRGKGARNTLKRVVSISCLSVGLWPQFAKFLPLGGAFRMPYNVEGDWIKNEK
jgi:hypothetical protein